MPYKNHFAPALFQSEITTVYYTGAYTASTGEQFTSAQPFLVLQPKHTVSCNFCEIVPMQGNKLPLDKSKNNYKTSKLFSFLIGLRNKIYYRLMKINCVNPNNQITLIKYGIDLSKLNIGQEADIQKLSEVYDKIDTKSDIVMYGFSRGAATTFNFLATEYKKKNNKKVKAVILSGCFDSIEHLIQIKLGSMSKYCIKGINKKFTAINIYKRKDPIHLANQFPKNIPLLLVASKSDKTIPYECTIELYKQLKKSGHDKVYLLTLENAKHHGHLFTNNQADAERYLHTVHAFYKHCGLSYIPEYAAQGETILYNECSPA